MTTMVQTKLPNTNNDFSIAKLDGNSGADDEAHAPPKRVSLRSSFTRHMSTPQLYSSSRTDLNLSDEEMMMLQGRVQVSSRPTNDELGATVRGSVHDRNPILSRKKCVKAAVLNRRLPPHAKSGSGMEFIGDNSKIVYLGRELNASNAIPDPRMTPLRFRRQASKEAEENLIKLQTTRRVTPRSSSGKAARVEGIIASGAVGSLAALSSTKPASPPCTRSELIRAASSRSMSTTKSLEYGFQKFEYSAEDVEGIANDDEYFRKVKSSLKKNGVVTNEVLRQRMQFYTLHHKQYMDKKGSRPKEV